MSARLSVAVGPVAVFVCHFLYLLPHYYYLNALILAERRQAEWIFRNSLLQTQICSVLTEIAWCAWHPQNLASSTCCLAALLHAIVQGLQIALAFGADQDSYTYSVALPLQGLAALSLIPVAQIGNNDTLRRQVSPARYRMLATLASVFFAVWNLVGYGTTIPWVAASCCIIPSVAVAFLLFQNDTCHASERSSSAESERKNGCAQHYVGASGAFAFLVFGCAVGTIGEAMMDMATTLSIRNSLQKGRQDLALTNQCSILISMSLAYFTETRLGGGAASRAGLFILSWTGCQLFRGAALDLLEVGSMGLPLLAAFAFLDKYTGPLGSAALDVALLKLMRFGARKEEKSTGVRPTSEVLWTARMVVSKVERPICQLVLLHTTGMPVKQVAWPFTLVTCIFVLALHLWHDEAGWKSGPARCLDSKVNQKGD
eukprot:TRINITY_DN28303_c0_g3_i1.p1 TRINITY_DN28303_c0_g3~~TRINITY_DN28303_c0_g3_i1.p1  ORF type:complete len:429 (-),score=46.65 TRINITY_DN28303_c0_g3_i1:78-1364(-)